MHWLWFWDILLSCSPTSTFGKSYDWLDILDPPGAQVKYDVVKSMLCHGWGWRRERNLGSKSVFPQNQEFFYLKVLCFLEAIFVDLDLREVVPDGGTWDNVTAMEDFRKQPCMFCILVNNLVWRKQYRPSRQPRFLLQMSWNSSTCHVMYKNVKHETSDSLTCSLPPQWTYSRWTRCLGPSSCWTRTARSLAFEIDK